MHSEGAQSEPKEWAYVCGKYILGIRFDLNLYIVLRGVSGGLNMRGANQ